MDDFSVYGSDFDVCLHNLSKIMKHCSEVNLVLNCEKCHFMVNEGEVLRHLISKRGIQVDRAKIEVIEKLPPLVNVKGVRSLQGNAEFYRRFIKDFSKIVKPLTQPLLVDATFDLTNARVESFDRIKESLEISDKKSAKDVVADHLSRLRFELSVDGPIDDSFPDDHLFVVSTQSPWYADFAYYCLGA